MDQLFDDIARILATTQTRRQTFRLLGGIFATALVGSFAVQPLSARGCSAEQVANGGKTCGAGSNAQCCTGGRCCAIGGQAKGGPQTVNCCAKKSCYCANGTCAASSGGSCPGGCTYCA